MQKDQIIEVWGEFACFTRPELKVERFSYPVITPSAARGIYDAIYCKPAEFRWQITMIELLAEPKYISLRRNEVKDKGPNLRTVQRWMAGKEDPCPIIADGTSKEMGTDQKGRTQRQTMALKNVRYRLHAYISPWAGFENRITAFEAQFKRRASQGKCIYQPYLGCREFPAYFELVMTDGVMGKPKDIDLDIGLMLYDVYDLSVPGKPLNTDIGDSPSISLFRAEIKQGVLVVPDYESNEVLKGEGYA
jgi:CRISPR-associated protein Cas5d